MRLDPFFESVNLTNQVRSEILIEWYIFQEEVKAKINNPQSQSSNQSFIPFTWSVIFYHIDPHQVWIQETDDVEKETIGSE